MGDPKWQRKPKKDPAERENRNPQWTHPFMPGQTFNSQRSAKKALRKALSHAKVTVQKEVEQLVKDNDPKDGPK